MSGSELGVVSGLFATGAGLSGKVEPGTDAATRTGEIAIAKDAPLGIQQIRFHGPGGPSNARYFDVGQWPEEAFVRRLAGLGADRGARTLEGWDVQKYLDEDTTGRRRSRYGTLVG